MLGYALASPHVVISHFSAYEYVNFAGDSVSDEASTSAGLGLEYGAGVQGLVSRRISVGFEATHGLEGVFADGGAEGFFPFAFRANLVVHLGRPSSS